MGHIKKVEITPFGVILGLLLLAILLTAALLIGRFLLGLWLSWLSSKTPEEKLDAIATILLLSLLLQVFTLLAPRETTKTYKFKLEL